MSGLFHSLEQTLQNSANYLPLEVFSCVGGFIEEVIAPIPSPFIMAAAGSAAFAQNKGIAMLVWLAFLGSVGKTLGSWIIYFIADKMEDFFVGKFGRFFGVSHAEVESIGKHFKGGWKDLLILFSLRALPIVPSAPVSVMGGVIKVPLQTFLSATLLGNFVRNFIYIYIGFAGVSTYESILNGLQSSESIIQGIVLVVLIGVVGWVYAQRRQKKS